MSAFEALKEISVEFGNDIQRATAELTSLKVGDTSNDVICKKLKDLALFASKSKLLNAKPLSLNPQISANQNGDPMEEFSTAAMHKVIEQYTVKMGIQSHVIMRFIRTPTEELDGDSVLRKQQIIQCLKEYCQKETRLRLLDTMQKKQELELSNLRTEWNEVLGQLRDIKEEKNQQDMQEYGPLYSKLSKIVVKLQIMSWLIGRLVCSRHVKYDWLADPDRRLGAIAYTRQHYNVHTFTQ